MAEGELCEKCKHPILDIGGEVVHAGHGKMQEECPEKGCKCKNPKKRV